MVVYIEVTLTLPHSVFAISFHSQVHGWAKMQLVFAEHPRVWTKWLCRQQNLKLTLQGPRFTNRV